MIDGRANLLARDRVVVRARWKGAAVACGVQASPLAGAIERSQARRPT